MQLFEQYDEICKYFTKGKQKDSEANEAQKHMQLHGVSIGEYLNDKYALWLEFRIINQNALHETCRKIDKLGGVTLQIEKLAELAGAFKASIYRIMDAQLNIKHSILSINKKC